VVLRRNPGRNAGRVLLQLGIRHRPGRFPIHDRYRQAGGEPDADRRAPGARLREPTEHPGLAAQFAGGTDSQSSLRGSAEVPAYVPAVRRPARRRHQPLSHRSADWRHADQRSGTPELGGVSYPPFTARRATLRQYRDALGRHEPTVWVSRAGNLELFDITNPIAPVRMVLGPGHFLPSAEDPRCRSRTIRHAAN
jgi:hypothetical protein